MAVGTTMDAVRTDLAARIAALDARAPHTCARVLAPELDAIRAIARRHGLRPAMMVAQLLDSALARGEHGPLVHGWLSVLHDAVRVDTQDEDACIAFAAACSVRLAG